MGQSTDAHLDYGYDLGNDDSKWKVAEFSDWTLTVPWYDAGKVDEYGSEVDFEDQARDVLWDALVDQPPESNRYIRERIVDMAYGVALETYQSCEIPMYLLSAHHIVVSRGDAEVIDLDALRAVAVNGDYDAKLARVLDVLGLHPTQQKPEWILTSMWC